MSLEPPPGRSIYLDGLLGQAHFRLGGRTLPAITPCAIDSALVNSSPYTSVWYSSVSALASDDHKDCPVSLT